MRSRLEAKQSATAAKWDDLTSCFPAGNRWKERPTGVIDRSTAQRCLIGIDDYLRRLFYNTPGHKSEQLKNISFNMNPIVGNTDKGPGEMKSGINKPGSCYYILPIRPHDGERGAF